MNIDDIPLKEPCCESWPDMVGDDRERHCAVCERDVINLSALTQAEAGEVLSRGSLPCVRFRFDAGGEIVFMHPQVRLAGKNKERPHYSMVEFVTCGSPSPR